MVELKELFSNLEKYDEKVLAKLMTAIAESQQGGFDYLKFKLSYIRLQQMGMDEAQAAKSAFMTASTMGFTKEELLKSAQKYLSVLNREKETFASALKNQIANNVDAKRVEINKAKERIAENIRKIEQLKQENVLLAGKIEEIESGMEAVIKKIEDTRDRFKTTFDAMYHEIEADVVLYNKFL
jgi:chromosome segregation ATPase